MYRFSGTKYAAASTIVPLKRDDPTALAVLQCFLNAAFGPSSSQQLLIWSLQSSALPPQVPALP